MNFLAHAFLSNSFDDEMLGNLMGDFVKGKPDIQLNEAIKNGIFLHRHIDTFTDSHPTVKASKTRLFPKYRHYANVIVDVFYDHFLAAGWKKYASGSLSEFAEKVYQLLNDKKSLLPKAMQKMIFYMQSQNWLVSYENSDGISKALAGIARRTKFESGMEFAVRDMEKDYKLYQQEFEQYFPQLIQYVDLLKINTEK
jgi:acyl carrier protein phosphodiesterase